MCVFNINRTYITKVKAHGRQETTPRLHSGGRKVANGISILTALLYLLTVCQGSTGQFEGVENSTVMVKNGS